MRRQSWVALLACLAAAGEVSAQAGAQENATATATEPSAPAAPAAPADAPASPKAASSGTGMRWRGLPPIATSGWVSYDLRATRAQDEPSTLTHLVTTSVSAYSYIYQPWFATVNGTLALTVGRSRAGVDDGSSSERFITGSDDRSSSERFVTGSGRVDFFPRSRFPFEVHVERSDSRVGTDLSSTFGYQSTNFGFSQRYRPPNNAYTAGGRYDRRQQSGAGFRDTQDVLAADFATRWKNHELDFDASYSQAHRKATEERTQFASLVGRHNYAPGNDLSVSSTVNLTQTREDAGLNESDISVLQGTSVGIWRPAGSKLSLTGSARGLVLRDAVDDHEIESLGATLGATYDFNRNLRVSANGGANFTSSDGERATSLNGALGANYQGDTIQFKGINYNWFGGGNVGASHASGETQTTLATQLGHSLNRSWQVSSASSLGLSAGQTLSAAWNRASNSEDEDEDPLASSKSLLHTLGATWSMGGDNRSAYARASYSDSKELGGSNSRFQLFNFQLSGTFQFDRNRSLTGDLTWQHTKQRSGDTLLRGDTLLPGEVSLLLGERSTSRGASGEIVYTHLRPFGVPRLRFTSRLKLAQEVLDQPGTFATIPDRETRLWENRLEWVAGRLETQLILRISEIDGKRRETLMWRLSRNFGG